VPERLTVTADGTVLFLRSRAGDDPGACLWALGPDSDRARLLAGPADLTAGGPTTTGIDGYAVDGAAVTPPGLQVRAVYGVDGEAVLFGASEDPTETHL
jgi:hypothetical protein